MTSQPIHFCPQRKLAKQTRTALVKLILFLYEQLRQLQARSAYLSGVSRSSKRTTQRLLNEVLHVPLSLGAVSEAEEKVSAALAAPVAEAAARAQRDALWTFLEREGVEPTNNGAERALRHAVLWRKCSYGVQSEQGARYM